MRELAPSGGAAAPPSRRAAAGARGRGARPPRPPPWAHCHRTRCHDHWVAWHRPIPAAAAPRRRLAGPDRPGPARRRMASARPDLARPSRPLHSSRSAPPAPTGRQASPVPVCAVVSTQVRPVFAPTSPPPGVRPPQLYPVCAPVSPRSALCSHSTLAVRSLTHSSRSHPGAPLCPVSPRSATPSCDALYPVRTPIYSPLDP